MGPLDALSVAELRKLIHSKTGKRTRKLNRENLVAMLMNLSEDNDDGSAVEVAGINIETEMNRDKFPQKARKNSRKSVRWSAVPVPCLGRLCLRLWGSRAAAPNGSMTFAFTHMENFLLLLLLLKDRI